MGREIGGGEREKGRVGVRMMEMGRGERE